MGVRIRSASPTFWFIEFQLSGVTYRGTSDAEGAGIKVAVDNSGKRAFAKSEAAALEVERAWRERLIAREAAAAELAARMRAAGKNPDPDAPTTLWKALQRHRETGVLERNRTNFNAKITRLCGAFGADTLLDDITKEMVHRWRDDMIAGRNGGVMKLTPTGWQPTGKPMMHSTVNGYLKKLIRVLRRAEDEWETCKVVPRITMARDVNRSAKAKKARAATYQEEQHLLATAQAWSHVHDYVRFLLDVGARRTEAFMLTWDKLDLGAEAMVDFSHGTKNNGERFVPISDDVRDMLIARKAAQRATGYKGDLVFAYQSKGNQYAGGWRAMHPKAFDRVREVAARTMPSVRELTLHKFRHTFVSRLVNETPADVTDVQAMAGHRNIATTMGYVHKDENAIRNVRAAKAALQASRQQAGGKPQLTLVPTAA